MESVLITMKLIIAYSNLGDRAISRHHCRVLPAWRRLLIFSFITSSTFGFVSSVSSLTASFSAASNPSVSTARKRLTITKEPRTTARYWNAIAQYRSAPSLRSYKVSTHPSIVIVWKTVAMACKMLSKPLAPKLGLSVKEQKASATGFPPQRHCSCECSAQVQKPRPSPLKSIPRRNVVSPRERQSELFLPGLKACVSKLMASKHSGLHR
eukprot:scaffold1691_cov107-Isochrysis_galbana.AAC.5